MKNLHRLKKSEYELGSTESLHNSKQHYQAAIILAEKGLFPFAITHLILSGEELIKAAVLKFKSIDNKVLIPDFDRYFRCHSFKHEAVSSMYESIKELKPDKKQEGDMSWLLGLLALGIVLFMFINRRKNTQTIQETKEEQDEKELDTIEQIRLASIYVRLLDTRKWKTPFQTFGEANYELAKSMYDEYEKVISNTIFSGNLSNDDVSSLIVKLGSLMNKVQKGNN